MRSVFRPVARRTNAAKCEVNRLLAPIKPHA
jgi:hypothetical protein